MGWGTSTEGTLNVIILGATLAYIQLIEVADISQYHPSLEKECCSQQNAGWRSINNTLQKEVILFREQIIY